MGFASKDTLKRAVVAYKAGGQSQQEVAAMFGVHYKIFANWLKADAEDREQCARPEGHLKCIPASGGFERIDQIFALTPSITIHEFRQRIGRICSMGVYSRALKDLDYA